MPLRACRASCPRFVSASSVLLRLSLSLWGAAALAQSVPSPAPAASAPPSTEPATAATLPAVNVVGQSDSERPGAYTLRAGSGATGLRLSPRETPQSVSVVTRGLMDDFKLNSVNAALEASNGVVVEKVETDRTYYTARGFDIVNFQLDGIGLPFVYGLVDGDIDTATYERVEVI